MSFRRLFAIMLKELRQMRRDRITLAMIVGIPVMERAATPKNCARFCHRTRLISTRRRYASLTRAVAWIVWPCRSPFM